MDWLQVHRPSLAFTDAIEPPGHCPLSSGHMVQRHSSAFIEPCLPSKLALPPSSPLWLHEIKHYGYRLVVRRDGSRVRCFTRNGHDWA